MNMTYALFALVMLFDRSGAGIDSIQLTDPMPLEACIELKGKTPPERRIKMGSETVVKVIYVCLVRPS